MRRAWRLWSKVSPCAAKAVVESLFAGVAEGRMADIVGQRKSLGEFRIQSQGRGESAGDLGYFERVGEAAAEVVGWRFGGQAGEDLGFARQSAKGARVQNAGGIAGKGSAIGVGRLSVCAKAKFAVPADGNSRGKFGRRAGFRIHCGLYSLPNFASYSGLGEPMALSCLASLTRALSSFFCTLATSPGSTSAGADFAYSASESSHCAAARRMRPVFS
jgi:hypothetical protein